MGIVFYPRYLRCKNFTHLSTKKDTLNTGGLIRLFMGEKALVHLALRSPIESRAGTPDSPSPSFTPKTPHISLTHREYLWPNAPCVRSRVTLPTLKKMCTRFFPAVPAGRRTTPMANSETENT